MSNANVDTLSDRTGTKSPTITGGELCRARFNLNGTGTIADRDSFNISSFVDNATGDYTSNFSTAFPNANYCRSAFAATPAVSGYASSTQGSIPNQSVSSLRFLVFGFSPQNSADASEIHMSFFGDKS